MGGENAIIEALKTDKKLGISLDTKLRRV